MGSVGGEVVLLSPQGTKKLWISSKLIEIGFDSGRHPENLGTNIKEQQ